MRFISLLLALLVVLQYSFAPSAVAATATFSGDSSGGGSVQATVPVNKIGALLLADASAFLNNSTIEVKSKANQDPNSSLLNGAVLNSRVLGAGAVRHIHGIAYFLGGSSLGDLCRKTGRPDRVKTTNGDIFEGSISEVGADGLTVGSQRIAANMLQCVDSPCSFEFDIPLSGASGTGSVSGEAKSITFSHCVVAAPAPVKQARTQTVTSTPAVATEHSTAKRVIVSLVVLGLLATAIAVPVAVACGHHHHHHNNNNDALLLQQQYLLSRRTSSSVSSQLSQSLSNPFFP